MTDNRRPVVVLQQLSHQFSTNLEVALKEQEAALREVELRARAVTEVAKIIRKRKSLQEHQVQLIELFDEIFADITCSIYFAGCALDNAAKMSLRRVLDLGVGFVYLWDLPHLYWVWRNGSHHLAFAEMVKHLSSDGFLEYVRKDNHDFSGDRLLDSSSISRSPALRVASEV